MKYLRGGFNISRIKRGLSIIRVKENDGTPRQKRTKEQAIRELVDSNTCSGHVCGVTNCNENSEVRFTTCVDHPNSKVLSRTWRKTLSCRHNLYGKRYQAGTMLNGGR
ncbi:hypothetical protein ROZALSC1DRAFT_31860 [Rozella allomycis CSF55]|uniref:Uncharacterized protein n=1 Tax=Rozella allomycis (strain CSF55) TaxID=988480 RepID=A0A4P9YAZ7_ROZAC|nr:hypothetical protein ROZALSC1DRAFT_31860 [Rozella allomycis CSF55]